MQPGRPCTQAPGSCHPILGPHWPQGTGMDSALPPTATMPPLFPCFPSHMPTHCYCRHRFPATTTATPPAAAAPCSPPATPPARATPHCHTSCYRCFLWSPCHSPPPLPLSVAPLTAAPAAPHTTASHGPRTAATSCAAPCCSPHSPGE